MLERIRRTRSGEYSVRLPREERELLRGLPGQLRALLTLGDATGDPALRRLFPPAYEGEPERAEEFDRMVRGDLLEQRLSAIDTMERTIDADRLSEDELTAWLSSINDLRLVLGTRLHVSEETTARDIAPGEENARAFALYGYLSYLEEEVVAALSRTL
ncbi:MAG TPA: DUF2017 family protein [Actinomycetota bacterium]|nr:DUF2017 family protein [Actinomycetota bacterium]